MQKATAPHQPSPTSLRAFRPIATSVSPGSIVRQRQRLVATNRCEPVFLRGRLAVTGGSISPSSKAFLALLLKDTYYIHPATFPVKKNHCRVEYECVLPHNRTCQNDGACASTYSPPGGGAMLSLTTPNRLACISHHPTVAARDTSARTSLRLLAVLNVLFKYACARQAARASRLVLTALSPTSPRHVVRNAG